MLTARIEHPAQCAERFSLLFDDDSMYGTVYPGDRRSASLYSLNGYSEHHQEIEEFIPAVLDEQGYVLSTSEELPLQISSRRMRERIGRTVVNAFKFMDNERSRVGAEMLIGDDYEESRRLVIGAAATALELSYLSNLRLSDCAPKESTESLALPRILALWGPKLAQRFFDGSVTKELLEANGLAPGEVEYWAMEVTPDLLRRFAVRHTLNPLEAINRFRANIELLLTEENIARELGWSVESVRAAFPRKSDNSIPSGIKYIASAYLMDPWVGLSKVKERYDSLSNKAIAARLCWSVEKVEYYVTPELKHYYAALLKKDAMDICLKLSSLDEVAPINEADNSWSGI